MKKKQPKPVEAWAPVDATGLWMATIYKDDAQSNVDEGWHLIRVRIVPVTSRPRRRKPKNPSDWKVGMSKKGVFASCSPKKQPRTKRKTRRKP